MTHFKNPAHLTLFPTQLCKERVKTHVAPATTDGHSVATHQQRLTSSPLLPSEKRKGTAGDFRQRRKSKRQLFPFSGHNRRFTFLHFSFACRYFSAAAYDTNQGMKLNRWRRQHSLSLMIMMQSSNGCLKLQSELVTSMIMLMMHQERCTISSGFGCDGRNRSLHL
ncbi:hypothetical protein NE237_016223 [Protea cynaroides]|uniref:Uncharacterized protein n=1 Tax=Protea cynaroides TaxID=273540 RepID=A0A9Q0QRS8_9MAGN|nr:hypothetical protein NE237_016223 [Protea cynaroides]